MRLHPAALAFTMTLGPVTAAAQAPAMDSVRTILRTPAPDSAEGARLRARATAYARAQVAAAPNDPWAHRALSVALGAQRDYDGAIAEAKRATELAPDVAVHWVAYSNTLFNKAGATGGLSAFTPAREGKAAIEKAVALDPENLEAHQSLMEFHLQAPGIVGGDKEEALRQAREIAHRNPVRGTIALLRVATAMNDENDLVFRFEQALRLVTSGHDSADLVRITLINLPTQIQDEGLKERFASRTFATWPDDQRARYARARLWLLQGKHLPEAIAIFQAYVALPQVPQGGVGFSGAHWRLGQALEKSNRLTDALAEYERSAAIVPHPADAEKDAERLRKRLGK